MKNIGVAPVEPTDLVRKVDVDTVVSGKLNGSGTVTVSQSVPSNSIGQDGDICFVYEE